VFGGVRIDTGLEEMSQDGIEHGVVGSIG
jgi:hypothetical protein